MKRISPNEKMRVLDVGFSENEYTVTANFIEKCYPYPEMLTALSVDIPKDFKKRYPKVTTIHYDGAVFPFGDKTFEVGWSNAVIEHVGNLEKQLFFLKEIKRVCKKAFITTPNRFFPIELHTRIPFLHYLPKKVFDKFLTLIGKDWATGDYMHLLSISDLTDLLNKAGITEYKIFKNNIVGFTLDFVVIFESK